LSIYCYWIKLMLKVLIWFHIQYTAQLKTPPLGPRKRGLNSQLVYLVIQLGYSENSSFGFWRYLTRGLIWHLSQSSIRPSNYFSLIVISGLNPFLETASTKQ